MSFEYKEKKYKTDIVYEMLDYEMGFLSDQETVDFFQKIVDSGLVWELQGHYGRTADALLSLGLIKHKEL